MPSREIVENALKEFEKLNIVVIGDLMLDRYIWGEVARISPEAPVPVVQVSEEAERPGGAGNVVLNLLSLGARCIPIGVIGDDLDGAALTDQLANNGATITGVVCVTDRPTTMKSRVIAGSQHVVRVDHENTGLITEKVEQALLTRLEESLDSADAVILQDYNKGVMTTDMIRGSLARAKEAGVPVLVDPKFSNFFEYMEVNIFKPNIKETERALGRPIATEEAVDRASGELLARLHAEQVLITRGSEGMSLYRMGQPPVHIPTQAKRIHDVSGAGDTVISTLALAHAAKLDPVDAASMANAAAGCVVGYVGVVPVTREALLDAYRD